MVGHAPFRKSERFVEYLFREPAKCCNRYDLANDVLFNPERPPHPLTVIRMKSPSSVQPNDERRQ